MIPPTDRQLAAELTRFARLLEQGHVHHARQAARHQDPDGYPATSGVSDSPGGGPAIVVDGERVPVTSTELAALNRPDRPLHRLLDVQLARIGTDVAQGVHLVARAIGRQRPDGRRQHIAYCANEACQEPLPTGSHAVIIRGRCEPCGRYLGQHDRDAPAKVIADRRRWRENRR